MNVTSSVLVNEPFSNTSDIPNYKYLKKSVRTVVAIFLIIAHFKKGHLPTTLSILIKNT
jgi:hypothetical protein